MTQIKLTEAVKSSIEILPVNLFLIDANGIIKYVNGAGASLLGIPKEKLLDRSLVEFITDSGKSDFQNFIQDYCTSTETQKIKLKMNFSPGESTQTYLIARSVKLQESKEILFSLSIFDLTSLALSRDISERSELRFENMANTAPVMIWIADVDGLFSFINKVWLDYTGEEIGAQLGMNWLRSVHADDQEKLLAVYKSAFKSREHFSAEFRFRRMNGEYQWMLINGSPRVNEQGIFAGFIGSCININEQIKNEEKIKVINVELTESNKTKDKFFSIISHDLRGPLSGLMQLLEIVADEYSSLEEEEKLKLISEAANSSKRTYNLMENLLEWSRVQSGKMEYEPERIILLKLINEIIALYDQNLKNKKINIDISVQENTSVFTDKKMVETVLRNLISNAIKFTHPNGRITLLSEETEDFAILKVQDTGVGINEEDLENLFRLDVSHSTKGTEEEAGTGLGLILCKELIERQGGRIWVESKLNKGSCFYFTIPLAM